MTRKTKEEEEETKPREAKTWIAIVSPLAKKKLVTKLSHENPTHSINPLA